MNGVENALTYLFRNLSFRILPLLEILLVRAVSYFGLFSNLTQYIFLFRKKSDEMNLNRGGLFWRNIITRPLSLSVLSGKDDKLLPGDINKFVRVFGFKNEATSIWAGNVLLSHRRRLRRALAGFCFTPLYLCK